VIWFLVSLLQPFHGAGHGRVVVDIPAGSGTAKVASILEHDGVISSAFFFKVRALLAGDRGKLRAGHYVLAQDMTYSGALSALVKGPPPVRVLHVLVPEGRSRRQTAALAAADGLTGDYLAASARSAAFAPTSYGAPARTPSLEGFLFPATYTVHAGTTAGQLVALQLQAFRRELGSGLQKAARRIGMTPYQVLIVASMVEGEAATARDRPLVAAVIYNRLRLHMPLGIDSTIRYALGGYEGPLTVSQLSIASPYNTRTHQGLPPTPIDSPGLAAIKAALHPANVPYLYYVVKPCGNGEQVFETSYAQFLRDSQAYQAARAARGGRSPTHC
jgi:UPF0755 protein